MSGWSLTGDKAKVVGSEPSLSMASTRLPELDNCVTVYHSVWDEFETDTFSVSDLVVELHRRDIDNDILDGGGPRRQLNLLVAYGLLEKVSDDRYRIRSQPEETQLDWWERLEERVEILHDAVHETREDESSADDRPLLTYRGRTYVSIFVDTETQLPEVIDALRDLEQLHDGVALRSPATMANDVQDIADTLSEDDRDDIRSFEKVNSEVKGTDSSDLEFRLYVTPQED